MTSRTAARLTGTTATFLVTAAMAAIPLAGIANAAPGADDLNCKDFASQAQAQQHYDADRTDPDQLDDDNDGQACENHRYVPTGGTQDPAPGDSGSGDSGSRDQASGGQVAAVPAGSVDAGDGSAVAAGPDGQADDPVIFILGGFGALAATGAAAAVWNTRRSGTSRR